MEKIRRVGATGRERGMAREKRLASATEPVMKRLGFAVAWRADGGREEAFGSRLNIDAQMRDPSAVRSGGERVTLDRS